MSPSQVADSNVTLGGRCKLLRPISSYSKAQDEIDEGPSPYISESEETPEMVSINDNIYIETKLANDKPTSKK